MVPVVREPADGGGDGVEQRGHGAVLRRRHAAALAQLGQRGRHVARRLRHAGVRARRLTRDMTRVTHIERYHFQIFINEIYI